MEFKNFLIEAMGYKSRRWKISVRLTKRKNEWYSYYEITHNKIGKLTITEKYQIFTFIFMIGQTDRNTKFGKKLKKELYGNKRKLDINDMKEISGIIQL